VPRIPKYFEAPQSTLALLCGAIEARRLRRGAQCAKIAANCPRNNEENALQISDISVRSCRAIEGMSAVLLPFDERGFIDFDGLAHNLSRTARAGLTPAVNMDTGYTNLLQPAQRTQVLKTTQQTLGGAPFIAGAFIEGQDGDAQRLYQKAIDEIHAHGGTPILFPSSALKLLDDAKKLDLFRSLAKECEALLAFELGEMFALFGEIYTLDFVGELMQIPQIKGIKHSSLNRELEWQRLSLRDRVRPDFKIYTGNDLAIDMVMYGSDYLLGLSAFCPEAFAARDQLWQSGDTRFFGLNDLLQYLGCIAFRAPVPAYKHNAAQFLKIRGRISADFPHPNAARRPESDCEILADISARLDAMLEEIAATPKETP